MKQANQVRAKQRRKLWLVLVILAGMELLFLHQFGNQSTIDTTPMTTVEISALPEVINGTANFTMSACLLLNDDNHFLVEWLAYHWQTLPLRRLVVATDPLSRTSPSKILKRWEPYMDITEWNDDVYFPVGERRTVLRQKNHNGTAQKLTSLHRTRQRHFYAACMRQLKADHEEGKSKSLPEEEAVPNWVAFIDVDEFLFPNWNWEHQFLLFPTTDNHGISQSTTIASILYRLAKFDGFQGPCIVSPRLLIGTNENNRSLTQMNLSGEQVIQLDSAWKGVFPSNQTNPSLSTWDWNWHEELIPGSAGKAILDISRVPRKAMAYKKANAHRPNRELCGFDQMWIGKIKSPLIVHHYIGSLEQFTFRSDVRQGKRTTEEYLTYHNISSGTVHPWETRRWLIDFVSSLGVTTAASLLEGAGLIEKDAPPADDPDKLLLKLHQKMTQGR